MQQRKFLAFLAIFGVVVLAVSLISVSSLSAQPQGNTCQQQPPRAKACYPPTPSWWTGHNANLNQYYVAPGYPAYDAHPRYLGELKGSWHDIGMQYGARAGDLIRMVFEGWYNEVLPAEGSTEAIVKYVHQQEAYLGSLAPEALDLMHGIAVGAKGELAKSAYANVMTDYEKILMINSYFALQAGLGGGKPAASCSGAVMLPKVTKDGLVIHTGSEDQHFFPQEYTVAYIASPNDPRAHRYTATDSAGEIGSQLAMNDKGVVVSGYAGASVDIGPRRPGLEWQVGVWFAAAFSDTAAKAKDLLTIGTPEYRKKSGNQTVWPSWCWNGVNWVMSDLHEAYVVESIPNDQNGVARYAIRRPGDMGEKEAGYIASTNNVEAKYSYTENNIYDPNWKFSDHGSSTQNPTYAGLNSNGTRFWTLMWLMNNNFGNITVDMVKNWRTAHYIYDKAGNKINALPEPGYGMVPTYLDPNAGTLCWHDSAPPGTDTLKGINIYVSIADPANLTVYRTKGRPCEWVGPWDSISLLKP